VLLALNFFLDFFLLWACGRFLRRETRLPRLLLAALLGAAYGAAMVVPVPGWLYRLPVVIAVSLLLLRVAYAWRGWAAFGRLIAAFYLVAFSMAGAALGGAWLFSRQGWYWGAEQTIRGSALLFGIFMAVILARRGMQALRASWRREEFRATLAIRVGAHCLSLTALIDTGNDLCEPLSGRPVVVAARRALLPLFPERLRRACLTAGADAVELLRLMQSAGDRDGWARRLRLVPFASLGEKHGLLPGFLPDAVSVSRQGESREVAAVVCFSDTLLQGRSDVQAVINPELLSGESRNERRLGA